MPQHLGMKHRVKAEASRRAVAIQTAMQVATTALEVDRLALELKQALADRESHREHAEDEFACAWHLDHRGEHAPFQSKQRVVYAVSARFEYDDAGESLKEDRFQTPMYLVACADCETKLNLREHLTE